MNIVRTLLWLSECEEGACCPGCCRCQAGFWFSVLKLATKFCSLLVYLGGDPGSKRQIKASSRTTKAPQVVQCHCARWSCTMPAMLDDPSAPAIYRTSGQPPFPEPYGALPPEIQPKQVTLRDRVTIATLVPFSSPHQVPPHLSAYLCELLNREIEKGDTYAESEPMALSAFCNYWFANFGVIMIMGDIQSVEEVTQMEERGADWAKECLGSFYVKPNYPGRSSHVCNGSFLVTDASRNRGVGRLMGEGYLEWAPKLGYTYSVFNLVYETNVASLRIWDALGFKRIGRVKGCGNLKSHPDQFIDAIIFGRELGGEGDEYVSEERFDKIRYYLKTGSYPNGADRAEKSRLRSAATHYKLVPNTAGEGEEEKLMLKGKEVVSDPHKQYEIARLIHAQAHGGINKTTASIAERYHWVRIKETVSTAIRNCSECTSAAAKPPPTLSQTRRANNSGANANTSGANNRTPRKTVNASADSPPPDAVGGASPSTKTESFSQQSATRHQQQTTQAQQQHLPQSQSQLQDSIPAAPMSGMHYHGGVDTDYSQTPIDPQIMQGIQQDLQHWDPEHTMQLDGTEGAKHEHMGIDVDARLREELEAQIAQDTERDFVRESMQQQRGR
ncbi:hypothetical protein AC579_7810 [Pseudocercospora musae]|uniref:N-acetyltransferase domain-containing protein n=1 Tax=Pseudocercospora musae TaxID=113226 RepID=A0A139IJQ9_9PEZI|nr:hypothetical protein AC579_7810 [Pseudocercospora musae]